MLEAADLKSYLERAVYLLKEIEWEAFNLAAEDHGCHFCGGLKKNGHQDGCRIASFFKTVRLD